MFAYYQFTPYFSTYRKKVRDWGVSNYFWILWEKCTENGWKTLVYSLEIFMWVTCRPKWTHVIFLSVLRPSVSDFFCVVETTVTEYWKEITLDLHRIPFFIVNGELCDFNSINTHFNPAIVECCFSSHKREFLVFFIFCLLISDSSGT